MENVHAERRRAAQSGIVRCIAAAAAEVALAAVLEVQRAVLQAEGAVVNAAAKRSAAVAAAAAVHASFAAVASADAASKAELLALGISKAMNTTAFGLISAITIMVIHQILTTKSEKIIGDLEHYSVKLVDLLSTRKGNTQQTNNNNNEAA